MDWLFGLEFPLAMKFIIAFAIVLLLIGTAAYLLRRFGTGGLATATQRNRQPRLAVVDSAPLDGRRKLVIVRRDNVEHLLMIGGPTDVVVEPNIVRAGTQVTRETAIRTASVEPLALPDENNWQPATVAPRAEPVNRPEPMARPEPPRPEAAARQEPPAPVRAAPVYIPPQASPQHQPAPLPHLAPHAAPQMAPAHLHQPVPPTMPKIVPQQHRPAPAPAPAAFHPANDGPTAAPAAESRAAPPLPPRPAIQPAPAPTTSVPAESPVMPTRLAPERLAPERIEPVSTAVAPSTPAPVRAAAPAPAPAPAPEPPATEEQNLADMANRLEIALRRPSSAAPPPTAPVAAIPPPAAPRPRPAVVVPPAPAPAARPQSLSQESLAREMASLLGRQQSGSS